MKITIDREVLEQAIDSLKIGIIEMNHRGCAIECIPLHDATKALREALAQPQQEPAGMTFDEAYASLSWEDWRMRPVKELLAELHRLTSPPSREPLTDDDMDALVFDCGLSATARDIARAIEAAHGIKETK